jgi:hypothetical protein
LRFPDHGLFGVTDEVPRAWHVDQCENIALVQSEELSRLPGPHLVWRSEGPLSIEAFCRADVAPQLDRYVGFLDEEQVEVGVAAQNRQARVSSDLSSLEWEDARSLPDEFEFTSDGAEVRHDRGGVGPEEGLRVGGDLLLDCCGVLGHPCLLLDLRTLV